MSMMDSRIQSAGRGEGVKDAVGFCVDLLARVAEQVTAVSRYGRNTYRLHAAQPVRAPQGVAWPSEEDVQDWAIANLAPGDAEHFKVGAERPTGSAPRSRR